MKTSQMEDNLHWWKTYIKRRTPSEDNLNWKTTTAPLIDNTIGLNGNKKLKWKLNVSTRQNRRCGSAQQVFNILCVSV